METTKFKKLLHVNDYSHSALCQLIYLLMQHMKETNEKNNMQTEFISMRLTNPEERKCEKDIIFEWAAIKICDDERTKKCV